MSTDNTYNKPVPDQDNQPRFLNPPDYVDGVLSLDPDNLTLQGENCTKKFEPLPMFNKADCELVIKNQNNSYIVLGRDRPDDLASGKGGAGESRCGTIDLCVGRFFDPTEPIPIVENNFKSDAARIYISQRTDVDANFALPAGARGMAEEKSAIAMRADEIRINARNGIKLVTGVYGDTNSAGQRELFAHGIELIAGGQDGDEFTVADLLRNPLDPSVELLQPLVKGDNMVDCIKAVLDMVQELHHTTAHFMAHQVKFNSKLMYHTHQGLAGPVPVTTAPDPIMGMGALETSLKTIGDIVSIQNNLENAITQIEGIYLTSGQNPRYICSDLNKTN